MITVLNRSEARDLLCQGHIARLGCIAGGEPYVVPVHYYVDGDYAFIHSLPGRKIEALRERPRACLQVDEVHDSVHWSSALAYGNYEEITDPEERALVLNTFLHRFPLLTPVESTIVEDAFAPEVIAFRLRLDTITGLSEG